MNNNDKGDGHIEEQHGLFNRIKGLKSELYKRVSKVYMSDDDIQDMLSAAPSPPARDPNLKPKQQSLHDVYRQLQFQKGGEPIADPPSFDTDEDKNTEENEVEVVRVLQDMKAGKPMEDVVCSRTISQRSVHLENTENATPTKQGSGFGVRIVGGKKTAGGMLCAFIASIVPGGIADKSGKLQEGDLVLRWNEKLLIGLTYEECQTVLIDCNSVILVVSNFLRGSYRRYKPRSSQASSGSVESILRGTTHKWITLAQRSAQKRKSFDGVSPAGPVRSSLGSPAHPVGSAMLKVEMRLMEIESKLSVHLIQAANIPYRDGVEGLDLFCKLQLSPDQSNEAKKRSKTSLRTYNPYWNQHFEYHPETSLSDKKLEVSLWAQHWLLKHELLGQMYIDLHSRSVLSGQASWFYLAPPPHVPLLDERTKSLPELMREKATIQYRTTFSTFDGKRSGDIRRCSSDLSRQYNKTKYRQGLTGDEDSNSDSVFTSQVIQTHLSNIKESDERPPIPVRGSPRRTPKMGRRTATKELAQHKSSAQCRRSRTYRSNSEDLTRTKHRVLPKTPAETRTKDISLSFPNKRSVSPLLTSYSSDLMNFTPTKVILTAPSSEDCANSSSDSLISTAIRPAPEGKDIGTPQGDVSQLGPGQIAVPVQCNCPGTIVLTLGIDKHMLTIEVVQANDLPRRPSGVSPDTYVKTYILLDHYRSHKEKTSIVRCNTDPVFNERITYIVNSTNKIIQVMVWDVPGALRRNTSLGEVMIHLNHIATFGPLQGRYKLLPIQAPISP